MPDPIVDVPRAQFHDINHDVRDALHAFVCKAELGELNNQDVRDMMKVIYSYRDKAYTAGYEAGLKSQQSVREFINGQPDKTNQI